MRETWLTIQPQNIMAFGRARTVKTLERDALFDYAVKTLGSRALTIGEIKEKLRPRAANPADVDSVLSSLKQYGYLNDRQVADTYAASRRDNQALGSMRVLRDLRNRRVPSKVAEEAVKEAFSGQDEVALIENFLARKFRSTNLREYLQEEKHLASAYRKLRTAGYSPGNSIQVLKRYASRAEELEGFEDGETVSDSE
jgi:regulatory protein